MMPTIVTAIIGIVCILLGAQNMKGNINSLHSYHRKRVSEEDRLAFGKKVGLGTIIIGIGVIIFAVFTYIAEKTANEKFVIVGMGFMIIGLIIGSILSFGAMIKYNKGIF